MELSVGLLPLAARMASGAEEVTLPVPASRFLGVQVLLDVTAAAAAVGDTLNVYVQYNAGPDNNPVWNDFISFTQVLGNGGTKRFLAVIFCNGGGSIGAPTDGTLTQGNVVAFGWSNRWRIKWTIAGSTPNFTFSIHGHFSHGMAM